MSDERMDGVRQRAVAGHLWRPTLGEWTCETDIEFLLGQLAAAAAIAKGQSALIASLSDTGAALELRIEHLRAGLGSLLLATDGHTVNSGLYQEIRARCAALLVVK